MGVAAYNRGSRVISAQFCRERGCPGCSACSEPVKPEPRPAGWGDKARARALDKARRIVSGYRRYGLTPPDEEILTHAVREDARVGRATAATAARKALSE